MLTLEEIKNVTFHKARNGYQTEDVDDFIDSVIECENFTGNIELDIE